MPFLARPEGSDIIECRNEEYYLNDPRHWRDRAEETPSSARPLREYLQPRSLSLNIGLPGLAESSSLTDIRSIAARTDCRFLRAASRLSTAARVRPNVIAITGSGVPASLNLRRRSSSDGAHLLSRLVMTSTHGINVQWYFSAFVPSARSDRD